MNIQALMKQAQSIQKDMMKAKEEIDNTTFTGENGFVKVEIDNSELSNDDIEMLQDMIVIAINDAFKKVDKMTESKLGKFTNAMPGMF